MPSKVTLGNYIYRVTWQKTNWGDKGDQENQYEIHHNFHLIWRKLLRRNCCARHVHERTPTYPLIYCIARANATNHFAAGCVGNIYVLMLFIYSQVGNTHYSPTLVHSLIVCTCIHFVLIHLEWTYLNLQHIFCQSILHLFILVIYRCLSIWF